MLTPHLLAEESLVNFDPTSAIWILGIFLVLVVVLYKTAWKHVLAGLNAREERIRSDIASAEAARAKAEASLKEFNTQLATAEKKAGDLMSQAAVDAEKIATSIKMRAQHEAEEIKERAVKEIEAAKQAAMTEIYEQTAELATSVAEKIIRRSLTASDQRDLVAQSLDELKAVQAN